MTPDPDAAPDIAPRGVEPRSPVVAVAASTVVHACLAALLVTVGVTAARAMRPEPAPVLVADWTPPPPPGILPPPPELPVPGGAPKYVGPAGRGKASPAKRKHTLIRFAELIRENADELALLETIDMGKPISDSRQIDIPGAAKTITFYGECADKVSDEIAPTDPSR